MRQTQIRVYFRGSKADAWEQLAEQRGESVHETGHAVLDQYIKEWLAKQPEDSEFEGKWQ